MAKNDTLADHGSVKTFKPKKGILPKYGKILTEKRRHHDSTSKDPTKR